MSLTDLKKSDDDKGKKKKFTVDEFISDSENYAKGKPELVSGEKAKESDLFSAIDRAYELAEERKKNPLEPIQPKRAELKKRVKTARKPSPNKKFRHATFTLSEEVIAELQRLSDETKLAKSLIIRLLISNCTDDEVTALNEAQKKD